MDPKEIEIRDGVNLWDDQTSHADFRELSTGVAITWDTPTLQQEVAQLVKVKGSCALVRACTAEIGGTEFTRRQALKIKDLESEIIQANRTPIIKM